jgi:hypothetical protein
MKESIKNHITKIRNSRVLVKCIYALFILIILSVVFEAGMFIGFHKAQFGSNWDNHYEKNFGARGRGPFGKMPDQFPNGHGTIGKIAKIELPNIIVIDRDNTEKVVIIDQETDIISQRDAIKSTDLKVGDSIVVIGSPNDQGQIVAKFIRMLPAEVGASATAPLTNPNQ